MANYLQSIDRKRFLLMLGGIIGMGVFLSFIIKVDYGSDTCVFFNMAISERIHLSYGTTFLLTNAIMFIPEILFERRLIGLGTVFNMVLIGYIADFCRYLEGMFLPESMFTAQPARTIVFILALIPFLISVAVYMNADMGVSPFDAMSIIFSHRTKLPFVPVRMGWDFLMIAIGMVLGRKLTIATVILALTVGPVCGLIGKKLRQLMKW